SPIGVAVVGAHGPVVGDGILDAASDRPPYMGVRQVERCKERRQVNRPDGGAKAVVFVLGVESAKGNTARGEDQGAVPGDADSATNRPLNVGTRVHRQ